MTQLAPLFHHASAGKVRDIKALSRTGPTGVACMMAVQAFQVQLEVERWTSNSDVTAWPFRSSSDQHISSTYPCLWWCGPLHSSTSTTSCGLYRIHRNPDERRISPDSMYLLLTTPLEWTRRQRSTFHLRQSSVAALPRCQAACRLSLTTSDSLPEVLLAISQEVYLEGACTAS